MNDGRVSILIVDDRQDKLLALEAALCGLGEGDSAFGGGAEIVRASSGREALRHVLRRDFAVILLDVNMPGMDGFETAALIRQRRSSEHTPIIFVTAFGDETHVARGYSLGAVDYILAPVVPEVLRSKVGVFVDLARKTEEVRRQAESLRRRAAQLQELAGASLAINGALSVERMLQTITDAARTVIGCHQAITVFVDPRPGLPAVPSSSSSSSSPPVGCDGSPAGAAAEAAVAGSSGPPAGSSGPPAGSSGPPAGDPRARAFASYSDRYAEWRDRPLRLAPVTSTAVFRGRASVRLTAEQLVNHPDWQVVRHLRLPPVRGGMMAAPLIGRAHDAHLGVIYCCDRVAAGQDAAGGGAFSADDEAILVQLAQMAAIAIENSLYAEEREANRIKDEFLATLSHELRTPLNAIMGWSQILRMQGPDGEFARGLEIIERNARAQTKLIEDLLDVSRIVAGKLRLNPRRVELMPVVRAALDVVSPAADAKGISLVVEAPPEPPAADDDDAGAAAPPMVIFGDPDRLQQAVWNLLSNAVKFTPAGGQVRITISRDAADGGDGQGAGAADLPGHVRICVRDTGQGIDPAFLPYVFDRFRQADASSTRAHGGLGIGLTIVRHIVELHGGTVVAESAGSGQGSAFTIHLPLAPAMPTTTPATTTAAAPDPASLASASAQGSPPGSPADDDDDDDRGDPARGNGKGRNQRNGRPARHAGELEPAAPSLAGVHVLLVDDEPDSRLVLAEGLRRWQATVMLAASAREARDLLDRLPANGVLISDIAMPEEDGCDLIRKVRQRPPERGGRVPAIALTAYAREEDRARALSAGYDLHLAKPVDPVELAATVARMAGAPDARAGQPGEHRPAAARP